MEINSFDFGAELAEAVDHVKVWPTVGEMTALLDGDLLPYMIGFGIREDMWLRAQNRVESGKFASLSETPEFEEVKQRICMTINFWVTGAGCDSAVIYMTDSPKNFRLRMAIQRQYKGTRKTDKPPFFYESRQFMLEHLGAINSEEEEADDLITIHLYEHQLNTLRESGIKLGSPQHRELARFVVCSKDKDLAISCGWHYSVAERKLHWVEELGELMPQWGETSKGKPNIKKLRGTGMKFFYSQMLQGDGVDNYTGIPRMKLMDIYHLLDNCTSERELYEATLSAYKAWMIKQNGNPEMYIHNFRGGGRFMKAHEVMHEQARLAHMQRFKGEIWRSDKVPVLWGADESLWN
ncbi:MAG: hypothetical protein [Bacteriophage sp.]|nr:MAG: hypothetical protein [Bacteriophage sp.]